MKKIIIDEKTEQKLITLMLNESFGYASKVKIIKDYLDKNYIKADIDSMNDKGDLEKQNLVIMIDSNKQPTEHRLTLEQLYYKLQYKFQKIISDKEERNKFIWNALNDWYFNRITKMRKSFKVLNN